MCVTLIGGMDRLKAEYTAAARECGCKLKCLGRNEQNFREKIGSPDMLIVFTNKVSHEAKRKAAEIARSRSIPIRLAHSCGVSTLKAALTSGRHLP